MEAGEEREVILVEEGWLCRGVELGIQAFVPALLEPDATCQGPGGP